MGMASNVVLTSLLITASILVDNDEIKEVKQNEDSNGMTSKPSYTEVHSMERSPS
jgi:hypothetical protein